MLEIRNFLIWTVDNRTLVHVYSHAREVKSVVQLRHDLNIYTAYIKIVLTNAKLYDYHWPFYLSGTCNYISGDHMILYHTSCDLVYYVSCDPCHNIHNHRMLENSSY